MEERGSRHWRKGDEKNIWNKTKRNLILFQTSTLARHEKPEGEGQDMEGKRRILTRSPEFTGRISNGRQSPDVGIAYRTKENGQKWSNSETIRMKKGKQKEGEERKWKRNVTGNGKDTKIGI
jgi:hypothetical protein